MKKKEKREKTVTLDEMMFEVTEDLKTMDLKEKVGEVHFKAIHQWLKLKLAKYGYAVELRVYKDVLDNCKLDSNSYMALRSKLEEIQP